ncbi:lytic transglycosylase domain-containing protein [Chitinophagaceae bacterium MMS25-I14]
MKRKLITYFAAGALAGAAFVAGLAFKKINQNDEIVTVTPDSRLQYKWYPPELPKSISFCGEKTPLERWDVRERLERELTINYYMHGSLLYVIMQTTRYFPIIEERLKANGIPDDFKYLCVAESALQHNTSPAGASSFWQLMKPTAIQYGLQVDDEVDERYNVKKATDVACSYFNQAYQKFGSWTGAAASYNCGMGGYNSHTTFQQVSNYYDVILPEETNRYIYRVLAYKYLISNAKTMGYIVQGQDALQPVKTRVLKVDSTITDLAQWSIANGSSYKMLKLLNPWLRARTLSAVKGKTFEIELPG